MKAYPSPPSKSWGGGSVISCHSCTAACPWIGSPLRQGHCGSPQQTCTWNCTPPPPLPLVATNHRCDSTPDFPASRPPPLPPSFVPSGPHGLHPPSLPASVTSRCIPPPGAMTRGRSPSPGHQLGSRIGLGWAKSHSFHTAQLSLIRCCCCHCCGAPPYPNHGSRQPRVRFTVSYPFMLARTRSLPQLS